MDPVRMHGVRAVERHVVEVVTCIGRAQHPAVVRNVLAVQVRAAGIEHVRMPRRRVDEVVVPALARAEVERVPLLCCRVVARQIREDRAPVATLSLRKSRLYSDAGAPRRRTSVLPFGRRVTAMSGRVVAIRVQRRLDLRPRRAAVVRAPDAASVGRRVDDVRIGWIDLDPPDAARRARVVLFAIARTSARNGGDVDPLWTSVHVEPPFVER